MPLLLALFLLVSFPVSAGNLVSPEVIQRARESIVHVQSGLGNKDTSICTGFIVEITRVVTAEHCIIKDAPVQVNGTPAKVLRMRDQLALLETQDLKRMVLPVAKRAAEQGEAVVAFGFAYGGPLVVYQRGVAGYMMFGDLLMDGPISPGMSGGPVINGRGEVVGVNEATSQHVGAATRGDTLRKFLK